MKQNAIVPIERIEQQIYLIRGQKVMLDVDLARLYRVPTKRLKEQVRRNRQRFPDDFLFRLTGEKFLNLRSHFATSRKEHGGTRYLPFAFTEQGVAMLSSVLNSERAVQMVLSGFDESNPDKPRVSLWRPNTRS